MFESTVVMQRQRNLRELRALQTPKQRLHVYRGGKWEVSYFLWGQCCFGGQPPPPKPHTPKSSTLHCVTECVVVPLCCCRRSLVRRCCRVTLPALLGPRGEQGQRTRWCQQVGGGEEGGAWCCMVLARTDCQELAGRGFEDMAVPVGEGAGSATKLSQGCVVALCSQQPVPSADCLPLALDSHKSKCCHAC